MTRNQVFADAVLHVLASNGELSTNAILPLVQTHIPDWCQGDWEHDVHNAQQSLKKQEAVSTRCIPGYQRMYYWRVA